MKDFYKILGLEQEAAQNVNFFQKDLIKYVSLIEGVINKIETNHHTFALWKRRKSL